MTAHKHLKQHVRARMAKTGESYAAARRQVVSKATRPQGDPSTRWHLSGQVPATTALRVLLAHAGVKAAHTGEPFSEAMLFGVAGGIGWGVFSFLYEKANQASFFLAGRHSWQDDLGYLSNALDRFGIKPDVKEAGGAKAAFQQLRDALSRHGPCVAWVDSASLPHRAMPVRWQGGGYHVVTVYRLNEEKGEALIGDLASSPQSITLADLAAARGRIKKQKNRLLAITAAGSPKSLEALVREGLRACLHGSAMKMAAKNFQLGALKTWAERLHGSNDKEGWERVFPPGKNLFRGLTSIYGFIEHYGTGGGLCRPLFAEFLREAAEALKDRRLSDISERYASLGKLWSQLAAAALPDGVPLFKQAKKMLDRKADLTHGGGAIEEIRDAWNRLDDLERQAEHCFPLSESQAADLRAGLQKRVMEIHDAEAAALEQIGKWVA